MRPEFTEFSYGFAFTREFLRKFPAIKSVPIFPSQAQEAQLAYDVGLRYRGLAIFFQYKLCHFLIRSNASYWSWYQQPYYRFHITSLKVSRQHNILKRLSRSQEHVFYAAPQFHTAYEFGEAYFGGRVTRDSVWVPLRAMPRLTDDEDHHVTFVDASELAWHTDRWNLKGKILEGEFSGEHNLTTIGDRFESNDLQDLSREYFHKLRNDIREIRRGRTMSVDSRDSLLEDVVDIRHQMATEFGLNMIVLYSSQKRLS